MNSLKLAPVIFAMLIFSASAEVYKCLDDNGKTRFSDQPCGDNAEKVTVESQTSGIGGSSGGNWGAVIDGNRERDRSRAITDHEKTIDRLIHERDDRLKALRARQNNANNNLAGATYRQSIASEMQGVSDDYNARIASERQIIRDLRSQ